MTLRFDFGPRRWWVSPDEWRGPGVSGWRSVPWWKPEGWFNRADKDSHWMLGLGWLWLRIRIGGGCS